MTELVICKESWHLLEGFSLILFCLLFSRMTELVICKESWHLLECFVPESIPAIPLPQKVFQFQPPSGNPFIFMFFLKNFGFCNPTLQNHKLSLRWVWLSSKTVQSEKMKCSYSISLFLFCNRLTPLAIQYEYYYQATDKYNTM